METTVTIHGNKFEVEHTEDGEVMAIIFKGKNLTAYLDEWVINKIKEEVRENERMVD